MRAALPLLLLLSGCVGCASVPSHNDLRATSLRLGFGNGLCSGTAIAAHTLVTAKHCLSTGGEILTIDGQKVAQGKVTELAGDAVSVVVTGITFTRVAKIGGHPAQGDHVRWWGNAGGLGNAYRTGYIVRAWSDELLLDAQVFGGDSGSGLFDERGRLIGVVIAARAINTVQAENLYRIQFAVAVPIR